VDEDFASEFEHFAPLVDQGLVTVADVGRPFVRLVAAAFDACRGRQGHSVAV